MDLRNLPSHLKPSERIAERRKQIAAASGADLSCLLTAEDRIGDADEKNCEQMFGSVPIPVGYAGPLSMTFSSGEKGTLHIPLATTEGALVASVNRGCKVLSETGVNVTSTYHGISRSIAFETNDIDTLCASIKNLEQEWKHAAEKTSNHLQILSWNLDTSGSYVFLTIFADTDEAMGMNMVTIAAEAIGSLLEERLNCTLITIAGNVDSDKKPSRKIKKHGRGFTVTAEALLKPHTITSLLKTTPEKLLAVHDAKLTHGSDIAGALSKNLHVANVIAALYLATGQDAAHTVEGSLADTHLRSEAHGLSISVCLPAVLVGIRGGGTNLPAQRQCLDLLLQPETSLRKTMQLAESIGAAVLAGEISLLAAQASKDLAKSHKELGRIHTGL